MMAGFGSKIILFLGLVALAHGSKIVKFTFEEDLLDNAQPSGQGLGQGDQSPPGPVLEVIQWLDALRSHSGVKVKAFSWSNCGKPSKVIQVKDLTVTPDPIKEGSPAKVSISGNFTVDISAPIPLDVLMEIKYMGFWHTIPCRQGLGSCSYPDICAKFPNICPLKKGPFSWTKSNQVPVGAPAATYRITANMKTAQGFLACIQILFDMVK